MIYALFIAGPICRDLRAFGGTNQAKKFAVGGPQLILRAGCLELVYLLASGQYMVQCRTGRRRHRNHRWDMEKPHGRITARRMGAGSSLHRPARAARLLFVIEPLQIYWALSAAFLVVLMTLTTKLKQLDNTS